jgi:hypothetical protein
MLTRSEGYAILDFVRRTLDDARLKKIAATGASEFQRWSPDELPDDLTETPQVLNGLFQVLSGLIEDSAELRAQTTAAGPEASSQQLSEYQRYRQAIIGMATRHAPRDQRLIEPYFVQVATIFCPGVSDGKEAPAEPSVAACAAARQDLSSYRTWEAQHQLRTWALVEMAQQIAAPALSTLEQTDRGWALRLHDRPGEDKKTQLSGVQQQLRSSFSMLLEAYENLLPESHAERAKTLNLAWRIGRSLYYQTGAIPYLWEVLDRYVETMILVASRPRESIARDSPMLRDLDAALWVVADYAQALARSRPSPNALQNAGNMLGELEEAIHQMEGIVPRSSKIVASGHRG